MQAPRPVLQQSVDAASAAAHPVASAWVERLALTSFRSYAELTIQADPGPVVVTGPNGAGKTNLLEAISMLAPGRGLRGSPFAELARDPGPGGWAVAARLGGPEAVELGTGALGLAPERRQARVNGAAVPLAALGERVAVSWLTPAMDRLLAESAGARRRFLDRLVFGVEPGHGRHITRYEAAMRERNRLLAEPLADPAWLAGLEEAMGAHGIELASARARMLGALAEHLAGVEAPFPAARLELDDATPADAASLAGELARRRAADAAAGRATFGPHRADLLVREATTGTPAARCSTGEQKALMIGVVLAHAALVTRTRRRQPLLLLDEVAAHLDAARRAALFERLAALGQVWVTGTEPAIFSGIERATRLAVEPGRVARIA